jgi:hypothetical protein
MKIGWCQEIGSDDLKCLAGYHARLEFLAISNHQNLAISFTMPGCCGYVLVASPANRWRCPTNWVARTPTMRTFNGVSRFEDQDVLIEFENGRIVTMDIWQEWQSRANHEFGKSSRPKPQKEYQLERLLINSLDWSPLNFSLSMAIGGLISTNKNTDLTHCSYAECLGTIVLERVSALEASAGFACIHSCQLLADFRSPSLRLSTNSGRIHFVFQSLRVDVCG